VRAAEVRSRRVTTLLHISFSEESESRVSLCQQISHCFLQGYNCSKIMSLFLFWFVLNVCLSVKFWGKFGLQQLFAHIVDL
jgi:hypothetical protein